MKNGASQRKASDKFDTIFCLHIKLFAVWYQTFFMQLSLFYKYFTSLNHSIIHNIYQQFKFLFMRYCVRDLSDIQIKDIEKLFKQ